MGYVNLLMEYRRRVQAFFGRFGWKIQRQIRRNLNKIDKRTKDNRSRIYSLAVPADAYAKADEAT